LLSCHVFASRHGERRDILVWKGDTLRLLTHPLDSVTEEGKRLSNKIYEHLYKKDQLLHPERYKDGNEGGWLSSLCLGIYEAEWHIIEDRLYLVNLYKCWDRSVKADMEELFPDKISNHGIPASWYNGQLVVGRGEKLKEYSYIYEKEQVFTFLDGQLKQTQLYTNWEKKSSFKPLDKPDEWDAYIYRTINWKKLPKLGNKALTLSIEFEVNQEGKAIKVTDSSADCFVVKKGIWGSSSNLAEESPEIESLKKCYIQEMIRIAYIVPQWDVVYQQGKINKSSYGSIVTKQIRRKYAR
jgi:hypothetical protein